MQMKVQAMKQEFEVTCPFCSLGCRYKILKGTDEVVFSSNTIDELDFDYTYSINEGALCPRGHFSYELLSHPMRLGRSFFKKNGQLKPEIPEIVFQNITKLIAKNRSDPSIAILINPMLSLHDIRALLDFANNNKITAVDFISPTDRHLFRASIDNPFEYKKCTDIREIKKLNYILCVGDIFTKQPILSRHILTAKYAYRKNALFTLNPIPTRTSWFSNINLTNSPHTEPLFLSYLFKKIYQNRRKEFPHEELKELHDLLEDNMGLKVEDYINIEQRVCLDEMINALESTTNSAIFLSTHHYNAATTYLMGILCSALSFLINNFFIPLYTDGNFNAIAQFSKDIFDNLCIGKRPIIKMLIDNKIQYVLAAGWNPKTHLPGSAIFSDKIKWIIFSLTKGEFPDNTLALFPQAHLFEQMDLRTNFLVLQSSGSPMVKSPIGLAQPIARFIYQFYQKAVENKISFAELDVTPLNTDWKTNFQQEWFYYLRKIQNLSSSEGQWLIPTEHVAHYKDGDLTRHSSWAKKACIDEMIDLPWEVANKLKISNKQRFHIKLGNEKVKFVANLSKELPEDRLVAFAHYSPVRKILDSEFAKHNNEYYFWCPKIHL
jgi:anaerobic selenocysteine-containing dehydrogenase